MSTRLIVVSLTLLPAIGCGQPRPAAAPAQLVGENPRADDAGRPLGTEGPENGATALQETATRLALNADNDLAQVPTDHQQLARGFEQVAQGSTRAVDFEQLQALLPTIAGWRQAGTRGEQLTLPVAYSRAEAVYHRDDSRIELEITDTALNPLLLSPVSMFLSPGFSERSTEGFRRAARVGGEPGLEEWNAGSHRGEVTAVVGNRFVVTAKGRDIADLEPVKRAVESIDFARLTKLR